MKHIIKKNTIKANEIIEDIDASENPDLTVICRHCKRPVDQAKLIGLSLICPLCGKPQNGDPKNPTQDPYSDMKVICKHCGKIIDQAKLRGISLICPLCDMPQNGIPHGIPPRVLPGITPIGGEPKEPIFKIDKYMKS